MRTGSIHTTAVLGAALLLVAAPTATGQQRPVPERGGTGMGHGFDPDSATPFTPHGQGGAAGMPALAHRRGPFQILRYG